MACSYLDCRDIHGFCVPLEYGRRMRSSVILMGSLLGRRGKVTVPYPGGCTIGRRPVDLHLKIFKKMGIYVEERRGMLHASCREIQPTEHRFPFCSVGRHGKMRFWRLLPAKAGTVLKNCAVERRSKIYVCFSKRWGVKIQGTGTDCLVIEGGSQLKDTEFTIPSDRIAAGTYLFAGAITRGRVTLHRAPVEELTSILQVYEKMGGQYYRNSGKLVTDSRRNPISCSISGNRSVSGFPTDMQSVLMSVLATVKGDSVIREQIFEERFKIVSPLNRMGARILVDGRDALIHGTSALKGQHVFAEELREGRRWSLPGWPPTASPLSRIRISSEEDMKISVKIWRTRRENYC